MLELILGSKLLASLLTGLAAVLAMGAVLFGIRHKAASEARREVEVEHERLARNAERGMAEAAEHGAHDGADAAKRMRDHDF